MAIIRQVLRCFVLILCVWNSLQVKLVNNGYEDIIVEIGDNIQENLCPTIFRGIEAVMGRASEVLQRATHQRTYFRNVTVVVPKHWSGSHCPKPLILAPGPVHKSDIMITEPHPVFLHNPWTLQEQGCGQPGHKIYLTPEFLALRNHSAISFGDPGRLFVHEWAKYRWGVFEEYGHPGDNIYPEFQQINPNKFSHSGCSNIPVKGITETCSSDSKNCHFTPDLIQNDNVTSSLMYLHYLPRVTEFCNSHTHDKRPQTKHNTLCGHRSVWEVMETHADFINSSEPPLVRDVTPHIVFIKPSPRRYVIIIEVTSVMNVQNRWDFLRKAIRKLFVYDLPAAHEVGVILFDSKATVKLPLVEVTDSLKQRQHLATASLPRNPPQTPPRQKCVSCALEEAVKMLRAGGKSSKGSAIILISSGPPLPDSDIKDLEEIVTNAGTQVVPVMYPVDNVGTVPTLGLERLAEATGTKAFTVLDEGMGSYSKVNMMVSLMNSLYASLRVFLPSPKQLPLLIHEKEYPGGISSMAQGTFELDETLGGEVRLTVTFYNIGHVGNSISLIDPNDKIIIPPQDEDGDVSMIFVTLRDVMPGQWGYRVENRADSHQGLHIQVLATPANKNTSRSSSHLVESEPSITLQAWTSHPSNTSLRMVDSPPLIYAKVWAGMKPVIGARVEAILQRVGFNSSRTRFQPIRFRLYDNGNGDADLTQNDGIYSRHIPALDTMPARYFLSVEASNADGKAAIVEQSLGGTYSWSPRNGGSSRYKRKRAVSYGLSAPSCCGSVIHHSRTVVAGSLSRIESIGVVDLTGQRSQPSKIGDFRASVNTGNSLATFHWTAPGETSDHGQALKYDVVISPNVFAAANGDGEIISAQWPRPFKSGAASRYSLRWGRHDTVYYVVIRAVSRSGKVGPWSNIASLYVPPPPTTTEINTRGSTIAETTGENIGELGPPVVSKTFMLGSDILAIIIAACILLLIVLSLSLYFIMIVSRRRHPNEKKIIAQETGGPIPPPDQDDETDSISKHPPESHSMSETPNTRSLSPIQSWNASSLLAIHARRHSTDPNAGESPDLGVPYNPSTLPYHTPHRGYIEDAFPMDSGSMISTQPSESFGYKFDNPAVDNLHITHQGGPTPVSWQGPKRPKVPPPTLPKPSISVPMELSRNTGPESKRRTITQV